MFEKGDGGGVELYDVFEFGLYVGLNVISDGFEAFLLNEVIPLAGMALPQ